jgi:hypothetical protein
VKTDELYKKEIVGLNVTKNVNSAYCEKCTAATATGTALINMWRSRDTLTLQQLTVLSYQINLLLGLFVPAY